MKSIFDFVRVPGMTERRVGAMRLQRINSRYPTAKRSVLIRVGRFNDDN